MASAMPLVTDTATKVNTPTENFSPLADAVVGCFNAHLDSNSSVIVGRSQTSEGPKYWMAPGKA